MNDSGGLLRQPTAAWLRVIGRVRPGASVEAVGPRLTGVLHQWLRARLRVSVELDAGRDPHAARSR